MFAAILQQKETLKSGVQYTLTYNSGRFLEYRTESWVQGQLRSLLNQYLEVLSVTRPLFSSNYVIKLVPYEDIPLPQALGVVNAAWVQMGYSDASFVLAESDVTGSSQPGGLVGAVQQTGQAVGGGVSGVLQPLLPYVLLAGGLWLLATIVRVEVKR
jgi:hypothetical protein